MVDKKFGMMGAAGFVAPRHMKAIKFVGGELIGACDPYDGVGSLDRYFPRCQFFTEVERFDRFLERARRRASSDAMDYLSICTPNYLHDAHCRMALRLDADAICEKPLVISPWNLDQLEELELEYQKRIYTILQLRMHPEAIRLRELVAGRPDERFEVRLEYVTRRGPWYHHSWKGQSAKSGGVAMNIGIHFFDLLIWLFGPVSSASVQTREHDRARGKLELKRADVSWGLSIRQDDLPPEAIRQGHHAYRQLTLGGDEFDFSSGFDDLHSHVYQRIIDGNGFGIRDARPSIELVHRLRTTPLSGS
jgi:UDP-N-acetyl-2-amino-2-deoxyglucuronate dehydrogenase